MIFHWRKDLDYWTLWDNLTIGIFLIYFPTKWWTINIQIFNNSQIIKSTYHATLDYKYRLIYFSTINNSKYYLEFLKKSNKWRNTSLRKQCLGLKNSYKWIHVKNSRLFFNKYNIIVISFLIWTDWLKYLKYDKICYSIKIKIIKIWIPWKWNISK